MLTEPGAITEALWQHRAELWTSVPEVTGGARAVLAAYFEHRTAVFPQRPPVGRARLSQLILRGKGAAPGADQEPYEVYHYGVDFVASLLAQAFHATDTEGGDPDGALGPSVDLLIWIPKASGTQPADGMRGLQLPSCMRRHFGAGLVGEAAPPLEASFSHLQAGVSGRNCGGNIRQAFQHLGSAHQEPAGSPLGALWDQVLGPAGGACARLTDSIVEGPLRTIAAVVAADQSKAFERLSHSWLRFVLDGWRMPRWMVTAFLVMVIGRHVCSVLATGATKPRALYRGVGMGGTSSPLTWNVCFDPVLVALAVTVDAAAPTYVDDLMCLVRGPRQAFAAMIFLVAVSRCAGLHTEMHRCAWIEATVEASWAAVAFAALPVEVSDAGGGWTRLRGLPQAILECLVIDRADGLTRGGIRYVEEECRRQSQNRGHTRGRGRGVAPRPA